MRCPTTAVSEPSAGDAPTATAPRSGEAVALPTEADYAELVARQPPDEATIVEETTASERERSQDAFSGLSDDSAPDLARERFGDLIHAEPFPDIDVPPGDEIAYAGEHVAVVGEDVTRPGGSPEQADPLSPDQVGQNALIESAVPLRAPEGGQLAPLDPDLERAGGYFEPDNAVVETTIPLELADGIGIEDAA